MDICLTRCEAHLKDEKQQQYLNVMEKGKNTIDLRQAYAGLQFICKEKKDGKIITLNLSI